MHVSKLLHKVFTKASDLNDPRISRALFSAIDSVVNGAYLTITGMGRRLSGTAKIKNKIKRMDRLLGNPRLQTQLDVYYHTMACSLIGQTPRPLIMVDWSPFNQSGRHHFISASVPVGGRTLSLLEIAYPEKEQGSQKAHQTFLTALQTILPKNCRPIIVTDAGFKNPWFKLILSFGWDFIGRSVSTVQYYDEPTQKWYKMSHLMAKATNKAKFLMQTTIAKTNPLCCYLFALKQAHKGRVCKNLSGQKRRSKQSLSYAKRAHTPWILVSSLSNQAYTASQIIRVYKKRMQIEEAFRDLKSHYNGLGLGYSHAQKSEKMTVALLIGAIARFILWCVGLAAKKNNVHRSYQANTIKARNVLSVFSIGKQFIFTEGIETALEKTIDFLRIGRIEIQEIE